MQYVSLANYPLPLPLLPPHRNEISATLDAQLIDAVESGREVDVKKLIEAGASPDARKRVTLTAKVQDGLPDPSPQQRFIFLVAICVFAAVIDIRIIGIKRARAILAPLRLQNPDLYNQLIWSSVPEAAAAVPTQDLYHGDTVDPSLLVRMAVGRVSISTTG
ncbi:hypothetical protein M427DRAFT_37610 [Gonapodya prolifera JEL478]|uniref:Uncharacterized protein n=1 Tax=Gonapodya prolifera (strain JEL478) TaxID=1344416 RepID=A0A139A0U0_GONPJ|nr:hypothetical protein M427DRAFT_37610 [Gonapodya prolifera JEL478]|eukprot:KXS10238.1 hypothetical protein M427DRAFT_37610 [Gonapodya prolifera JEL478]